MPPKKNKTNKKQNNTKPKTKLNETKIIMPKIIVPKTSESKDHIGGMGGLSRDEDDPDALTESEMMESSSENEEIRVEEMQESIDNEEDEDVLEDTREEVEEDIKVKEDEEDHFDDGDEECFYKLIKKKGSIIGEEDEEIIDEGEFFEEETVYKDTYVPDDQRITKQYLTKYERVRILGIRAKQLSLGAKPMIKNVIHLDPKEIAKLELQMGVIPLIIERPLPTGQKERWRINELRIIN